MPIKYIQKSKDGKWKVSTSKTGKATIVADTQKEAIVRAGAQKSTEGIMIKKAEGWTKPNGWEVNIANTVDKASSGINASPKTPVKKATTKKATTKKVATKKTPVKKATTKKATTKKVATKKTPVKKATTKKATTKKVATKKTPVKKATTKKVATEKTPVKKATTKKVATKKTPVKKATTKKVATEKTPVKKVATKKTPVKIIKNNVKNNELKATEIKDININTLSGWKGFLIGIFIISAFVGIAFVLGYFL